MERRQMRYLFLLCVALIPASALAQTTTDQIPQSVRNELANDLSSLQSKLLQLTEQSGDTSYGVGSRKITITKNSVNVRAGASSDAKTLMKATFGDSFRV